MGDAVLVGLKFFINAYFLFLLIILWLIGCRVFFIEMNPNDYAYELSVDPESYALTLNGYDDPDELELP